MQFGAGSCFALWDNSGKLHLRICLTDASGDPPSLLTAIVNTANSLNSTHNFLLRPGDHPFIKHPSVVNYSSIVIVFLANIEQDEKDSEFVPYSEQMFRPQSPIDLGLLDRIVEGALASKAASPDMKAELSRRIDG